MKVDEGSPVDFIFGKIPRSLEPRFGDVTKPGMTRLGFELGLIAAIYGLVAVVASIVVQRIQYGYTDAIALALTVIVITMLSTWKHLVQIRYGKLGKISRVSGIFIFMQSVIAVGLISFVFIAVYFTLHKMEFIQPMVSNFLILTTAFLLYVRVIANLSVTSAGTGLSVFSSVGGIKAFRRNLSILQSVYGPYEFVLATSRIILWVLVFSVSDLPYSLLIKGGILLVFVALAIHFEPRNTDALNEDIGELVTSMSPRGIPAMKFDETGSFVLPKSEKKRPWRGLSEHKPMVFQGKDQDSVSVPTKQELTPIAAKSMERLAKSILNEE